VWAVVSSAACEPIGEVGLRGVIGRLLTSGLGFVCVCEPGLAGDEAGVPPTPVDDVLSTQASMLRLLTSTGAVALFGCSTMMKVLAASPEEKVSSTFAEPEAMAALPEVYAKVAPAYAM
jgi:hypothetical protein